MQMCPKVWAIDLLFFYALKTKNIGQLSTLIFPKIKAFFLKKISENILQFAFL